MAQRSNGLFTGLLFLLVFLLLVALNPTRDEFAAWMSARQAVSSSQGVHTGVLSALGKAVGGMAGSVQGGTFRRHNYAFCSIFESPSGRTVYLGVAKLFIKLR